ncbi:uncharacterized protein K02A2.6-like [Armigeres subalbatus]|uniref:uncharacterized protein K02A2.6-like n=1 Tax=Armigeres subalbatus TaxID=124917 RepID=UPI002ED2EF15
MGLMDRELQKSLLMSETLTLEAIEKKLLGSEVANRQTKAMASESRKDEVHSVKSRLGKKVGEYSRDYDRNKTYRGRGANRYDRRVNFRGRSPAEVRNRGAYANAICNYCKKRGHLRRDCFSLKNRNSVHHVEKGDKDTSYDFKRQGGQDSSGDETDGMECLMISAIKKLNEPCMIKTRVQNCFLKMEIDSGSAVSVISETDCRKFFKDILMRSSSRQLIVVDGARLRILGEISVQVELNSIVAQQKLVVLKCNNNFVPLIGRSWLDCFFPGWRSNFTNAAVVNSLNEKKGYEGELILKKEQPIFKKAYTVPYKLKDKLAQHLQMLEQQKVITPIKASEWASPVIVVVKKDQDIRMVIDCKVSINKSIVPNTYPLPLAQDIFASLAGCRVFCCLDLAGAYTYSKWVEVEVMLYGTDAKRVINSLMTLFRSEDDEEPFMGFQDSAIIDPNPTELKRQKQSDSLIMTKSRARKMNNNDRDLNF